MVLSPLPGGVLGRRQRAGWAETCAAAPGALLRLKEGGSGRWMRVGASEDVGLGWGSPRR